jgi:hypothetical protein
MGMPERGDVPAQLELARTSCIRSWRRHRAAPGAGRPESAADHETGARCRHRRTGRRKSAGHGVYQIGLPPSGRWSTIAARPRAESGGYPGQLEGNGPYLVALRSPGRAPGGPGTRPGLTLASTPSTSTAPGRDGDRRGGTSHRAGRCWPAAWAASPPPVRRCDVLSLRRPRWLRA